MGKAKSNLAKGNRNRGSAYVFWNPHVYIDTVILLGSIGNQFVNDRWWFWFGASIGSFVWFFGLGLLPRETLGAAYSIDEVSGAFLIR